MGLFSALCDMLSPNKKQYQNITVSAQGAFKNIESVFDEVAKEIIDDLMPFSDEEKKEILKLSREYTQHMDERTMNQLWDKFFSKTKWEWKEFEFWRSLALQGEIPPDFKVEQNAFDISSPEDCFELASLQKIKPILLEAGLVPPKKDITKWAKNSLLEHPELLEKVKNQCIEKQKRKELHDLLTMIRERSRSMKKLNRSDSKELIFVNECDKPFIEKALKRNPKAIPPYWPGSIISYKLSVKEFD